MWKWLGKSWKAQKDRFKREAGRKFPHLQEF
jgi:hypothetical protein